MSVGSHPLDTGALFSSVLFQPYLCSVRTPLASAQALGELASKTPVLPVGITRSKGRGPGAWAFGELLEMGSEWRAESNPDPTSLCREIGSTNRALLPWLLSQRHKHNKACCPFEGVRPSPQQVRPTNLYPVLSKKLSSPIPLPALHLLLVLLIVVNLIPWIVTSCGGFGASHIMPSPTRSWWFLPRTSGGPPG